MKPDIEHLIYLEESYYEDGHDQGLIDAVNIGSEEGEMMGFDHGNRMGREVGFYSGCAEVLEKFILEYGDISQERVLKAVRALKLEVQAFPKHNSLNINILESLDRIRGRYKSIRALMNSIFHLPVFNDLVEKRRDINF